MSESKKNGALSDLFIEPETVPEAVPAIDGDSETKLMMFASAGRLKQALTLLEGSVADTKETIARVRSYVDAENKLWIEFDTDNGVHVVADALPLSNLLNGTTYVHVYDLCQATRHIGMESTLGSWIDEGKLYMGAFYNDKIGGFELEVEFEKCKPFIDVDESELKFNTTIDLDQMTISVITDSIYEFDAVEMYRLNGVISYRTGNERCTIATVMNNQPVCTGNEGNFKIRIPANIFKTMSIINAMDDDITHGVKLQLDTEHKTVKVEGTYASIVAEYTDGVLETFNTANMKPCFSITPPAISAAIGMYFKVNYINPTGDTRVHVVEDGLIAIEPAKPERINVNLSVGDVKVTDLNTDFVIPMDVFTMMIRNANCPELTLERDAETGRIMMRYGNGVYLRKCTYSPEKPKKKGKK